jgi:hypothetical protein
MMKIKMRMMVKMTAVMMVGTKVGIIVGMVAGIIVTIVTMVTIVGITAGMIVTNVTIVEMMMRTDTSTTTASILTTNPTSFPVFLWTILITFLRFSVTDVLQMQHTNSLPTVNF